jgi:hypothetical protein
MALTPHQFMNDNTKIMWAFSFMKSGRAVQFMDRHMRSYQNVGSILYKTWGEFIEEFVADFCLKNEVQTLRTIEILPGQKDHQ